MGKQGTESDRVSDPSLQNPGVNPGVCFLFHLSPAKKKLVSTSPISFSCRSNLCSSDCCVAMHHRKPGEVGCRRIHRKAATETSLGLVYNKPRLISTLRTCPQLSEWDQQSWRKTGNSDPAGVSAAAFKAETSHWFFCLSG